MALFEDEFFKDVQVCWPRDEPKSFIGIRSQLNALCCYAFPVMNCIYADMYKNKRLPPLKGSEQEMLDCLHRFYAPKYLEGRNISEVEIPDGGFKNNYSNAFEYVKERGILTANDYPWEGIPKECRRKKNPDCLIRIDGYRKITKRELVVEELSTVAAVAGTVVMTQAFYDWNGVDVYKHSDFDRNQISEYKKKKATFEYGRKKATCPDVGGGGDAKAKVKVIGPYEPGGDAKAKVKVIGPYEPHALNGDIKAL